MAPRSRRKPPAVPAWAAATNRAWARERQGRRDMSVIDELKGLDTNRETLDKLLLLNAQGNLLRGEYDRAQMDVPEWLVGALDTLDSTIKQQSRDNLMLRLKELEQQESGLKTAAERRTEIAAAKEKLQRRLGLTPVGQ